MQIRVGDTVIEAPDGSSISVTDNQIIVNGVVRDEYKGRFFEKVEITGNVESLKAGGSVVITGNCGQVEAGDSVECKDVYGSVRAGDSVHCGNITGSVKAGDSIHCKSHN